MNTIYLGLMAAPFMVGLDLLWVGLVANKYYRSQLGALFTSHILVWPVLLFYVIYLIAIAYFVLTPAVAAHSYGKVLLGGALLGLVAYGTYDLINLAITAGWPLPMSLVDMGWGVVVTLIASSAAYFLATGVFGF